MKHYQMPEAMMIKLITRNICSSSGLDPVNYDANEVEAEFLN